MLLPLVVLPYFLCDLADRTKLVRSSLASSLLSSKATDDATDEGDKDTKLKGSIYHEGRPLCTGHVIFSDVGHLHSNNSGIPFGLFS